MPTLKTFLVGGLAAVGTALLIGVPTVVIPNPLFTRMVSTRPLDYAFLALTALLMGLIAGTYTVPAVECRVSSGRMTAAGLLSFLAVGCPVCNKLVILLLGVSGAMNVWAPLQPVLGAVSVALLGMTLWLRIRSLRGECPAPKRLG